MLLLRLAKGKVIVKSAKSGLLALALIITDAGGRLPLVPPAAAQDLTSPWPVLLRRDLARAGRVEWRLRAAAGTACPRQASDIGIVFDDRRAYRQQDWPLLEKTLAFKDYPVIAGVAPESPAALSGVREGDELVAIGGDNANAILARRKVTKLVADALLDEIDNAAPNADLVLTLRRDGALMDIVVRPVTHCAVRLVLFTDRRVEAHSDNRNVAISTGMLAFARTDDELALVGGHEFAHVIHGDRRGAPIPVRRLMEDAADRVGLQLMECAGYDRDAGIGLFERLGKRDWLGFLNAPTHRSWSARIDGLRALPPTHGCPVVKQ